MALLKEGLRCVMRNDRPAHRYHFVVMRRTRSLVQEAAAAAVASLLFLSMSSNVPTSLAFSTADDYAAPPPALIHFVRAPQLISADGGRTLKLTFTAANVTFHLELKPDTTFFHPEASVVYQGGGSESASTRTEAMGFRSGSGPWVYKGRVLRVRIPAKQTSRQTQRFKLVTRPPHLGMIKSFLDVAPDGEELVNDVYDLSSFQAESEARIIIHSHSPGLEDTENSSPATRFQFISIAGGPAFAVSPRFEGFVLLPQRYGGLHHISLLDSYIRQYFPEPSSAQPQLPLFPSLISPSARSPLDANAKMVLWRDADRIGMVDGGGKLTKRSAAKPSPSSCAGIMNAPSHESSWKHTGVLRNSSAAVVTGGVHPAAANRLSTRLYKRVVPPDGAPTAGCPTSTNILYVAVAADCSFVTQTGGQNNARMQIFRDFALASALYEKTFHIKLGMVKLEIFDRICPSNPPSETRWNQGCSQQYPITQRLSDFSLWRGKFRKGDSAGIWHLATNCPSASKVGVAWTDSACMTDASLSSTGQWMSSVSVASLLKTDASWKVIAHEIAHTLGALHDCTGTDCAEGNTDACCQCAGDCDCKGAYIMNPIDSAKAMEFSPCSIAKICRNFAAGNAPCIKRIEDSKNTHFLTAAMCGNGIVEEDEECDAGLSSGGDECCTAQCSLKPGAVCSDANHGCCSRCTIVRDTTKVCRPAISACDYPETCAGTDANCPPDKFHPDREECGPHGLKCASGQCTSRDSQCLTQGGKEINVTKACAWAPSNGCEMLCNSPANQLATCSRLPGYFMNGTECGFDGTCQGGVCVFGNSGILGPFLSWVVQNPYLSAGIAMLFLFVILFSCCGCVEGLCRRNRKTSRLSTGSSLPFAAADPGQPYTERPLPLAANYRRTAMTGGGYHVLQARFA